jgi:hypothetical protein
VSLKGSLQTVALPEVLHLLADTGKTGELHVVGSQREGSLWFENGSLAGHDVASCDEPFEAIFELLRVEDGEFEFVSEAEVPTHANRHGDGSIELGPALELAEARLAEWVDIVSVVPSLNHRVQLVAEPPGERVELDRSQWELVVAIGAGRSVGEVLADRGLKEFEGCGSVRDLAVRGLVEISDPQEVSSVEVPEEPVSDAVDDVPSFADEYLPFVADDEPVVTDDQPIDSQPVEVPTLDSASDHYASLRAVLSEVESADSFDRPSSEETEVGAEDGDALTPAFSVTETDTEPDTTEDDSQHGLAVHAESRAALHALLAEVTSHAGSAPKDDEAVDGLLDRGPWTSNELASLEQMGGWRENDTETANTELEGAQTEVPEADSEPSEDGEHIHAATEVEEQAVTEEDEAAAQPGDEPINRGLLLKFLSSVRS